MRALHIGPSIQQSVVEDLLQCPILNYVIILEVPVTVLKVKIKKCYLYTALSTTNDNIIVCIWKARQSMNNKTYTTTYNNLYSTCQHPVSAHHKLKLTTWNCRGLTSGEPYIHELANKGSNIIVVTEHWLWPYETKRLSEVHPDFAAECTTDSRLHENSDLIRGCGGVGVMFRKSLHVSPISSVSSDCICGIQIHLTSPDPQCITVLGVYLSCADQKHGCILQCPGRTGATNNYKFKIWSCANCR